jgi:hypothetical protein
MGEHIVQSTQLGLVLLRRQRLVADCNQAGHVAVFGLDNLFRGNALFVGLAQGEAKIEAIVGVKVVVDSAADQDFRVLRRRPRLGINGWRDHGAEASRPERSPS